MEGQKAFYLAYFLPAKCLEYPEKCYIKEGLKRGITAMTCVIVAFGYIHPVRARGHETGCEVVQGSVG